MEKDQKNRQEEMYLAIELWQESGLSQRAYCKQEGLTRSSFEYWLKKYRREDNQRRSSNIPNTFIPVEISPAQAIPSGHIHITYPNGIRVSCPVGIPATMLKTLLTL